MLTRVFRKPSKIKIKITLETILRTVEALKGNFDLDKIFQTLGQNLKKINISACILIFDESKNNLIFRYCSLPVYSKKINDKAMLLNGKKIPFTKCKNYTNCVKKRKAHFITNRQKQLNQIFEKLKEAIYIKDNFNSIVIPIIIRGEVIGLIEFYSEWLTENNLLLLENFTTEILKNITTIILYQELKISEKRYRNLVDNAHDGIFILNPGGYFIYSNDAVKKLIGYSENELSTMHFTKLIHEDDLQKVKTNFQKRLAGNEVENNYNMKIIKKDKNILYVSFSGKLIHEDNRLIGIQGIVRDVTEKIKLEQIIKKNEKRYREFIEGTDNLITQVDKYGNILYINQASKKILGLKPEECIGLSTFDFVHPEDKTETIKIFEDWRKQKITNTVFENRQINKKTGEIKDLIWTINFHYNKNGEIETVNSIARDITDSKRVQNEIFMAKEHFKAIINSIQDSLFVIDKNLDIKGCNKSFAEKINLPIKKIIGQKCQNILPKYEDNLFNKRCTEKACGDECEIKKFFTTKKAKRYIEKNRNKEGKIVYHNISIFPSLDQDKGVNELVVTIRDITKHEETEEQIRKLSEFNQRILDTVPINIIVTDKNHIIISANNNAKNLLHHPEKQTIGRSIKNIKEIAKNRKLINYYDNLIKCGQPFHYNNFEYYQKNKNHIKYFDIIGVPLYDKKGNVHSAISMAVDNTEEILTKIQLKELNKNLEEIIAKRTHELDDANKNLQQAIYLKNIFIADASHELRTPLTVMHGNLELAIKENNRNKNDMHPANEIMLKEIEKMANILTDLTMLSNADTDKSFLLHEKIDIGEIISSVVKSLKVLADQKKIAFNYKEGVKHFQIYGDEPKLEKLLLNIVRNAIKYTNKKGKIQIWTEAKNNNILIYIKDNGLGIPKADLPFIFERFYRVDKARSRTEGGTGLGLSISKCIADLHKGEIKVKSTFGKGSEFIVILPKDYLNVVKT